MDAANHRERGRLEDFRVFAVACIGAKALEHYFLSGPNHAFNPHREGISIMFLVIFILFCAAAVVFTNALTKKEVPKLLADREYPETNKRLLTVSGTMFMALLITCASLSLSTLLN
jgi:hypothetical protein